MPVTMFERPPEPDALGTALQYLGPALGQAFTQWQANRKNKVGDIVPQEVKEAEARNAGPHYPIDQSPGGAFRPPDFAVTSFTRHPTMEMIAQPNPTTPFEDKIAGVVGRNFYGYDDFGY